MREIADRPASNIVTSDLKQWSLEDLRNNRRVHRALSIVDEVDIIVEELWIEDDDFVSVINSSSNDEFVHGSLRDDKTVASLTIHTYAKSDSNKGRFPLTLAAHLNRIGKALTHARRRNGISVNQVRAMREAEEEALIPVDVQPSTDTIN